MTNEYTIALELTKLIAQSKYYASSMLTPESTLKLFELCLERVNKASMPRIPSIQSYAEDRPLTGAPIVSTVEHPEIKIG